MKKARWQDEFKKSEEGIRVGLKILLSDDKVLAALQKVASEKSNV